MPFDPGLAAGGHARRSATQLAVVELADSKVERAKANAGRNENAERINRLLFGYQDYAVIARKPSA